MPKKASNHLKGSTSTLSKLASFLESAIEVAGQISIHPPLNKAVAKVLKPGRPLPGKDVAEIVQALDSTEPALCSRLEHKAFVSIFAILRLSEPSWPQQRGLCLLTESLHGIELETEESPSVASSLGNVPSLSRKALIGREIMRLCLKHFRNGLVDAGARRWTGLLTIALLKDCEENVKVALKGSEEDRYMLGHMVIGEQNEVLRFIAGSIIRQLASQGVCQDLFWPSDGSIAIRSNFFESQLDSSQWPELLEGYLDEMDSQLKNHEQKFTPFSYLLQLGSKAYSDTAPSFLVTLDGQLSIIVPELTTTSGDRKCSQYVDVPINNINRVEIQEALVDNPTSSADRFVKFAVIVHLAEIDNYTMFVNAAPQSYPFLRLAFDDRNVADTLRRLILGLQDQTNTDVDSVLESEKLPDSGEFVDSDDESDISPSPIQRSVPKRDIRGSWSLLDPDEGYSAEGFESINETTSVVGGGTIRGSVTTPISAHRVAEKDTPLDATVSPGEEQSQNINHPPKHKIDMLGRVGDNGREKPRGGKILQSLEAESIGILAIQGTRSPLDAVATSSAQWRDGVDAIDNAPELASQILDIGRMVSSSSNSGETGTTPRAEAEVILPPESKKIQTVNHNRNKDPSDTTAVDREGPNTATVPLQIVGLITNRKRKASEISKRLQDRVGEQIESVGTDEENLRHKKYSKSIKGDSINDNDMPAKKSSTRKKITYTTTSKPVRHIDRGSHDAELGDLAGEGDVFAIPDSPARPSKPLIKTKQRTTTARKAKSTNSKGLSRIAKTKPMSGAAMGLIPKKASASGRTRAHSDLAIVQENMEEDDAQIGSDDRSMLQGEKLDNGVEKHPLMTTSNGDTIAGMSRNSPKQMVEEVAKVPMPAEKINKPSTTELSGRNSAIASKSRVLEVAVPKRQVPRRMAAAKANQKLQGLETKGASVVDMKEKLNSDSGIPESRQHVRRSDEARQIREHSALQAGPSFLPKSQLSTVDNKDKNRLELSPTVRTMESSKRARHPEANVDVSGPTTSNLPNPLLTTSSHVSSHSIELADDHSQDPYLGQGTDISKPLVCSVEPRYPEESVDLVPACNMSYSSNEIVEKHFEEALDFTGGDNEIKFEDTFSGHEPTDSIAGRSPQLQNLDIPLNLEAGRVSSVDQVSHPTSFLQLSPLPMTTPTMIPPFMAGVPSVTRTNHGSSTRIASNSDENKTPLPSHDIPAIHPQYQHIGIQTLPHSLSPPRPVQDHLTIMKPVAGVQDVILNTKPTSPDLAEDNKEETTTAVKSQLEHQMSKPYPTGQFSKHSSTTTKNNIKETAITQGLVDATVSQPSSMVIENSSGVETSLEDDFQRWSSTERGKEEVSSKRKSDGLADSTSKKTRADTLLELSKPSGTPAKPTEQPISLNDMNVEATDDRVQCKPIIIGFNSEGPRNQGISSAHKLDDETQISVSEAPVLTKVQSSSRKRKHIEEQQTTGLSFGPLRAKNAPIKKLRSTITAAQPTPQATEKLNVQINTSFLNRTVRQLSSQRPRVQENGSPVATGSQVPSANSVDINRLMNDPMENLDNDISLNMASDRVIVKQMDWGHDFAREVDLPPKMSLPFQQRVSSMMRAIDKPMSTIGKLLPSSPNASPWVPQDMGPYYEHTDGNLVNLQTADVVQVAKISDPFIDKNHNQKNSFIEMLRATGGAGKGSKKPNPKDIDFTLHDEGVKYIKPIDEDQTLVERRNRRHAPDTPSSDGYSSSSHSSGSKAPTIRSGRSDSEAGEQRMEAERDWREGLQQYQKAPLRSLSEVSNRLVRYLGSKEFASGDTVTDFTEGGTRLVEGINEAHAGDRKMLVDKSKQAAQTLEGQLGGLALGLGEASRGVRELGVADLQEASSSEEEERRRRQLEAAIGAFGN